MGAAVVREGSSLCWPRRRPTFTTPRRKNSPAERTKSHLIGLLKRQPEGKNWIGSMAVVVPLTREAKNPDAEASIQPGSLVHTDRMALPCG
jgi:hypothetical protein